MAGYHRDSNRSYMNVNKAKQKKILISSVRFRIRSSVFQYSAVVSGQLVIRTFHLYQPCTSSFRFLLSSHHSSSQILECCASLACFVRLSSEESVNRSELHAHSLRDPLRPDSYIQRSNAQHAEHKGLPTVRQRSNRLGQTYQSSSTVATTLALQWNVLTTTFLHVTMQMRTIMVHQPEQLPRSPQRKLYVIHHLHKSTDPWATVLTWLPSRRDMSTNIQPTFLANTSNPHTNNYTTFKVTAPSSLT